MVVQYTWITYSEARQQLAARLADPNNVFWLDAENGLYIIEALQVWNCLTGIWNVDFVFQAPGSVGQIWYSVPSLLNSPRASTTTDNDVYTLMEYHLLEPPSGGTWTGTPQFSINDLSGALQRRRDEVIQITNCNLVNLTSILASANSRRTNLPDTTLELRRVRWVPNSGFGLTPVTLWREDSLSFEYFDPTYLQGKQAPPTAYDVISGPPLSLITDNAPPVNGNFDLVLLQSGAVFNPPNVSLLGIPNDFAWVAKFGALSDLLGRDSEATDTFRAEYCLQRYRDGLMMMMELPWITLGQINGVVCGTPSVAEADAFSPEWDSNPNASPNIITAGVDFIAVSPVPTTTVGVTINLIQNAPLPAGDDDFLQVSRDTFDVVLDYAQHLAAFKMGGPEFAATKELAKNFFLRAQSENVRLKNMGLFRDVMLDEGHRQEKNQPRLDRGHAG